jgi:hypothetical protein
MPVSSDNEALGYLEAVCLGQGQGFALLGGGTDFPLIVRADPPPDSSGSQVVLIAALRTTHGYLPLILVF